MAQFIARGFKILYMKTANEINNSILATTTQIQALSPEVSKYIIEMPVTAPDEGRPEITPDKLLEYDESMKLLLLKYSKNKPVR